MKRLFLIVSVLAAMLTFFSCNTGEGTGGTGTVEGTVFTVLHPDDNYNLDTDTIIGSKVDVFLVYGNQPFYGDDVKTDHTGFFRFKYLRPGTYTVYAYSTLASGERVAVMQTVTVERGKTTTVPTLYVHEGKAYGTSMVKGRVMASYIDKNGNVISTGPAYEQRMYIQRVGESFPFDDVRAGMDGIFMFQKLDPGDYTVYTVSIIDEDEIPCIVQKNIHVDEPNTIVEFPEDFQVTIRP